MVFFDTFPITIAISVFAFLEAVKCIPTSPNREPFGVPNANDFHFNHQESEDLNHAYTGYHQPHVYDWNTATSHSGNLHGYGEYHNNLPHMGHQNENEFGSIPSYSLNPGASMGYASPSNYPTEQGSSYYWTGHTPLDTSHQQSSFDPSAFENMHLSDSHVGIQSSSYMPSEYDHYSGYATNQQYDDNPYNVPSPTHEETTQHLATYNTSPQYESLYPSTPTMESLLENPLLNGRHKVSDHELSSRSDKLKLYEWQKYYNQGELEQLYGSLFVWEYVAKAASKAMFKGFNEYFKNHPHAVDQVLGNDTIFIDEISHKIGPGYYKRPTNSPYNPSTYFTKDSFVTWILGTTQKGRRPNRQRG